MAQSFWKIDETPESIDVTFPNPEALVFSTHQLEYMTDPSPLDILMCGRGGGKDFCATEKKLLRGFPEYFRRKQDPNWKRGGRTYTLYVFAATKDTYDSNFEKLWDFLPRFPANPDGTKNFDWREEEQEFHLFGRNEFVIKLVTLWAPNTKRGAGCDDALIAEAQEIAKATWDEVVRPMIFRPFYPTPRCSLVGTGNCEWFDQAYLQASEPDKYPGYFNDWRAWHWTSFDSPGTTADLARAFLKERDENPYKFERERLGLPMIIIPPDQAPDKPIKLALLERAFTVEPIQVQGTPIISFDLFYGGRDEMVRTVWDKSSCGLADIKVWTQRDFSFDVENPDYGSFVKLFSDTLREWPGATIIYDATGKYGANLKPHLPPAVAAYCRPITRNNPVKNQHVSNFLHRLMHTDDKGRSVGIRLPDPKGYPFKDNKQREHAAKMYEQMVNYTEMTETSTGKPTMTRFNKGEGYGDDYVDSVTIACSILPAMRQKHRFSQSSMARSLV